jgi:hypothetical protein
MERQHHKVCICMYMYMYTYIYIYTHTHKVELHISGRIADRAHALLHMHTDKQGSVAHRVRQIHCFISSSHMHTYAHISDMHTSFKHTYIHTLIHTDKQRGAAHTAWQGCGRGISPKDDFKCQQLGLDQKHGLFQPQSLHSISNVKTWNQSRYIFTVSQMSKIGNSQRVHTFFRF